jgi:glycerol-3-phosphate dehydrogenase
MISWRPGKGVRIIARQSKTRDQEVAGGYRNVVIVGDGGMGSVLSLLLCEKGVITRMWGYDAAQLAEIERRRENWKLLPGYRLPESLAFEPRDDRAVVDAELIVSAVPCQYMRGVWTRPRESDTGGGSSA